MIRKKPLNPPVTAPTDIGHLLWKPKYS
jgi:hypothetical protein